MMIFAAAAMFGQPYRDAYGQPGGGGGAYYYDGYYDAGNAYPHRGYVAPPPPRVPVYAYGYRRPPLPGPGCVWVDGYWGFNRGRYVWMNGYWARPPYGGALWVAPRYSAGRFYGGFWSGPGRGYYGYRSHHNYRGYRR